MKFKKFELNHSPYIGVYGSVSNEYGLFPKMLTKAQEKIAQETLEIEVIKADLGEAFVNGAISKLYKNKVVLAKSSMSKDVKFLEKQGLDVLQLNSYLAVGNLIAINDNGLLLSPEFSKKAIKDISEFFGKKAESFNVGNISLVGSAIALNNTSIAVFPHVSGEEFAELKKIFKAEGNIATVNYGDGLVANGLLINDKGVLMGKKTTGYEIIRLDDVFG